MTSGYRDPTLSPIEDPTQLEELFPRCTPKTTPTNTPSARKANKTLLSDGSNPEKKSTEKKRRTKKKGTRKTSQPSVVPVALVGDVAVDNILDLNFSHETLPNVMAVRPSPLGLANHNVNMVLSPTTTPPSWQMSQLGETKIPNPHGGSVSSLEPQTSAPNFPASQSKLKDTKIEIAGGREVYSQSRSRVGRNKNRGESKRVPPPVIDILSGDDSSSNHGQHDAQNKNRVKETVFSSEVHSFEYDKPEAEVPRRRSYETDVDGNSVVYPDLCALDVNVTYDLIDGEFPPPSGLTVRPGDESVIGKNGSECMGDPTPASQGDPSMSLDLLSQSPPPPRPARQSGSEGRHSRSGESPSQHVSRGNGGSKGHMGGIAIDEYEGSPRRYRPRFDGDMMEQQTPMSQSDSRANTNSVVAPMAHQDSRESIHVPESSSNSTLSTPSSSVSGKVQKARKRAPNNHCGGKLSSPQTTVVPMSSNSGGNVMASSRLPGFPQRVLPATSDTQSTPSSSSSKEESPLSDHKSSIGAAQSSPSSSSTSSSKSNTSKRRFKASKDHQANPNHHSQQLDPRLSSTQNAAALIASLPTTMSATSEQQLHYQQQQFLQHQKELQHQQEHLQKQQQQQQQPQVQHLLNTSSTSSSMILETGNRLNVQASKQGNEPDATKAGGSVVTSAGSSAFEPPKVAPSHVATESSHDLISQETLLKFDDVSKERRDTSSNKTSSDLYNYQYEFSETRKVLDEFFPETRIPSSTSNISYQNSTLEKTTPPPSEFRDLNYTLRRRTSPEATSTENETFTREGQDLSGNESGGNQPTGTAFLNSIQQPHVGLSPLDQPLVNIGNGGSIQGSENQAASLGLMKIQRNATAQPLAQQQQQQQHPQLGGGNNSHNCDTGYATLNSPEAASRISHPPKGAPQHGFHRGSDAAFGGNGGNGGSGQTNNCDCSRNFTLSPETTDCDSADLESEVSMNEGSFHSSGPRLHTAMPILEDGLSSGHASDLEEDVIYSSSGSMVLKKSSPSNSNNAHLNNGHVINSSEFAVNSPSGATTTTTTTTTIVPTVTTPTSNPLATTATASNNLGVKGAKNQIKVVNRNGIVKGQINADSNPTVMVSNLQIQRSPTAASHQAHPPPQVVSGEMGMGQSEAQDRSVVAALQDIKMALQSSKTTNPHDRYGMTALSATRIPPSSSEVVSDGLTDSWHSRSNGNRRGPPSSMDYSTSQVPPPLTASELEDNLEDEDEEDEEDEEDDEDEEDEEEEVGSDELEDEDEEDEGDEGDDIEERPEDIIEERVPTPKNAKDNEDDLDTDQETDRLLGQQYNDDKGYFDSKVWQRPYASRVNAPYPGNPRPINNGHLAPRPMSYHEQPAPPTPTMISAPPISASLPTSPQGHDEDFEYDDDDDDIDCPACRLQNEIAKKKGTTSKTKEAVTDPKVLIEGVLFRARYLGSTQLVCEGQPTKATRMMQAEEAVSRIKAPAGENQPSTEVDLFISTEKIMVLNTDLKEIMMDHALRSISYIADIGELLVIMARRRLIPNEGEEVQVIGTTPKMICHVFESDEAQFIAQSIGQAFQVAYMEFLKANGIDDHSFVKEMDYQEVLNSQEIFGDELAMFAKKELQKEVVVPKAKGEILGVVIVESGWGSMLPTIVLANLSPTGPASRCGQLNIGDQIIAINGISLVGLPLSTCQNYIKNTKNKTAVKLTAVSCAPVVEVKIKRPDTKYQLGFSVQNGVICSLLRGGIAERGGVRVGHRIIEINGQSVVAVPHERIVNLLATSVGEITMKTMPTSMFRLLTGQETPMYI